MNQTHQQQIANTILAQLGGAQFQAMTGAHSFVARDSGLTFLLPGRKINHIEVTLTPDDLYDITYRRVSGAEIKVVAEQTLVYADALTACFEAATGLRCSL